MLRSNVKSLILAVVTSGVLAVGTSESQAHWGRWGWGGYWGGYSCCGGWYGAGYWGRPYRHWGYGWGGWGGCCWNSCCYDTCCYSSCCDEPCCGSTVVSPAVPAPTYSAPVTPTPAPAQTPALPPEPSPSTLDNTGPQTQATTPADAGLLTIQVPEGATVYVNGYRTKSTGSTRQYVSRGLKPGLSYKYEVRAEMVRDGRLVEDTQVVYLRANNSQRLAFSFDANPAEQLASTR